MKRAACWRPSKSGAHGPSAASPSDRKLLFVPCRLVAMVSTIANGGVSFAAAQLFTGQVDSPTRHCLAAQPSRPARICRSPARGLAARDLHHGRSANAQNDGRRRAFGTGKPHAAQSLFLRRQNRHHAKSVPTRASLRSPIRIASLAPLRSVNDPDDLVAVVIDTPAGRLRHPRYLRRCFAEVARAGARIPGCAA